MKRGGSPSSSPEEEDITIGPVPSGESTSENVEESATAASSAKPRKAKKLKFESTFLRNIPKAEAYEKSFMHRDFVTHVAATQTDFIITASIDGHVKFWKKLHNEGIEFVKHFRAHLGAIIQISVNSNGTLLATISDDKSMKIFDIVNFDMINMMKLSFMPRACAWIHNPSDPIAAIAVSDRHSSNIHIFDGRGSNDPLHTLDKLHSKPVTLIDYNPIYESVVSIDEMGMIEYWTGPKHEYEFPATVQWQYKTDTDLYEFAKLKITAISLTISPNGYSFATFASDRKLRIFRFGTGKLTKIIDESIQQYIDEKEKYDLPNPEFNRRVAIEKELQQSQNFETWFGLSRLVYDESSNFLLYPTMIGIKVVNMTTNRCVRLIGKQENLRFLSIALCRAIPPPGAAKLGTSAAITAEMEASDNPALQKGEPDPMLVSAAYKKNRFYLFTNTEPYGTEAGENERDVFNEKPKKEEMITAVEESTTVKRITDTCSIHTTMGDIHCKLFPAECPKTVENFCTHARQGYFNGHLFHRVIKAFMIQTGDPTGTGMGGESIWGHEFEDEFHPSLKHDRPYTMSMANAGPNTNGSQFFITVCPTPHLDGKHTVFGRVTKGMEVVQNIGKVRVNPKNNKPYDDVSIISITLK